MWLPSQRLAVRIPLGAFWHPFGTRRHCGRLHFRMFELRMSELRTPRKRRHWRRLQCRIPELRMSELRTPWKRRQCGRPHIRMPELRISELRTHRKRRQCCRLHFIMPGMCMPGMRTLPVWNAELQTCPFWNANASKTSSVRPSARPHARIAHVWIANTPRTSSVRPFALPHAWDVHAWNEDASNLECGIADVSILECERFENVVRAAVRTSACLDCKKNRTRVLACERHKNVVSAAFCTSACLECAFLECGRFQSGMRNCGRFHSGMRTLRKRRQCGNLRVRMPELRMSELRTLRRTSSMRPFALPHAWNVQSWNADASSLE